jgi:putative acetyltransferase
MKDETLAAVRVDRVDAYDAAVGVLLAALDAELATGGYAPDEQFGYDVHRLAETGVHLVGAWRDGRLVGIGGLEISGEDAELKRFYVDPAHRGSGVADEILQALVAHAAAAGVKVLRLETGNRQHAALRFYRRHGFRDIPRFGPYVNSPTSLCLARDLTAYDARDQRG